jgi:chromosome partitioning protein
MVTFTAPLRQLIGGVSPRTKGHHRAQIISVCARKGGVGKTTTAVNVAAGLALGFGKKVLLVDVDAQGHVMSSMRSLLKGISTESLTSVLLNKRKDLHDIAMPTAIERLFVTPSDKDLSQTEGVMSGRIGKEFLLRRSIEQARTEYDFIIIDCPPNIGHLTVNALVASDWVLVPCDMSILALEGVDDIFDTLETLADTFNHNLGVLGIVPTRYDSRNHKVNEAVLPMLRKRYSSELLNTFIPVNTRLAQAQVEGEPIFVHDPSCPGARAYDSLLDELALRLGIQRTS